MSKVIDGTTTCPKCKNIFPAKLPACPKCGHELTDAERDAGIKKNKKNMIGCLSLMVIAAVVYFAWPQKEVQPPSYTLLPYSHAQTKDTSARADRKRARVSLVLDAAASPVTAENLAATCMSAAKYYTDETSAKALQVIIYDQQGTDWGHTQLARCSYSPDNGGWSGSQNWTWEDVTAAERTTSPQEKEISRLWNELRGNFQKNDSTDEAALSQAIAEKMGIPAEAVHLPYLLTEKRDVTKLKDVQKTGPTQ